MVFNIRGRRAGRVFILPDRAQLKMHQVSYFHKGNWPGWSGPSKDRPGWMGQKRWACPDLLYLTWVCFAKVLCCLLSETWVLLCLSLLDGSLYYSTRCSWLLQWFRWWTSVEV